jgi:hypothetical protein
MRIEIKHLREITNEMRQLKRREDARIERREK